VRYEIGGETITSYGNTIGFKFTAPPQVRTDGASFVGNVLKFTGAAVGYHTYNAGYGFEYGFTSAYGNVTPCNILSFLQETRPILQRSPTCLPHISLPRLADTGMDGASMAIIW